jgi:hypothetical protein
MELEMNDTKNIFTAFVFISICACGPMPESSDSGIMIDESKCMRGLLESDGLSSSLPKKFDAGAYVISSTYLRIKPTREAGKKFSEVNAPLDAELRQNAGLLQAVTLISNECNTARTLSLWRDEASMMRFVASGAHGKAIGAIGEISRGGSMVTHWNDDGTGFTWAAAAAKVKEFSGPFY